MDGRPEQLDPGAIGLAGICRKTFRVVLPAILHDKDDQGTTILVVHVAANRALLSLLYADDSSDLVFGDFPSRAVCTSVLVLLSLAFTATYVFRVASFYCTDRIVRSLPHAPLARLVGMFLHVTPLAMAHTLFSAAACLVLVLLLGPSNQAVSLPLRVIGAAACFAGTAYVSVLLHIACVVSVLQGADLFFALRKSRALLAGKFWAAAAVFVPLDVCFVALEMSVLLVLEDALGLGRGFQVAAGTATAVALWAVVVVTLVAQPAVYLMCKNKVLQPVKTEKIPATLQCSAGQSPAGRSATAA